MHGSDARQTVQVGKDKTDFSRHIFSIDYKGIQDSDKRLGYSINNFRTIGSLCELRRMATMVLMMTTEIPSRESEIPREHCMQRCGQ